MNTEFLKTEERILLRLKAMYQSFGYEEYKLSGFEEYSLYAENQSFLVCKDVITFHAGGKLLALRPDVTLSVVKNVNPVPTRKLYYDEKVYRKSAGGGFAEVSQIGVEIIGRVDGVARAELCALMLGTLERVGRNFVVDASHMGIIVKVLDRMGLTDGEKAFALDCLRSKNAHDFHRFAARRGVSEEAARAFEGLISLPADNASALGILSQISETADISSELAELEDLLSLSGGAVKLDFSIVGDADYYNGLIFKGYVEGVPHAVLSGGRYDKLLDKFGKSGQAVGFALYLGELGRYLDESCGQPEIALLYGENSQNDGLVLASVLRAEGRKVLLCREIPEGFSGEVRRVKEDV